MAGMYIDCREKPVPQRVPESADLGNPAMRTHFAGLGATVLQCSAAGAFLQEATAPSKTRRAMSQLRTNPAVS